MSRKEKDVRGREARAHRTTVWRFLPALLALIFLAPITSVSADTQITSGTAQVSNALEYGNTVYSIEWSYPSTAQVGTNLTIAVTLHVISLNGLVEYVAQYGLYVYVYIGTHVLNNSVSAGVQAGSISAGVPMFLYPGATWGPNDVTFPLTENNTGIAKGQSTNATVTIRLGDTVWVGGQALAIYLTEPPMQTAAGGLVIQNQVASASTSTTGQGTTQNYLPYVLLVSGAVLILLVGILTREPRPQANKK
jgi:hypothetical protein